jgi:hypothetical protein
MAKDHGKAVDGEISELDPPILGKSRIEYVGHALDQMKIRGISKAQVEKVLRMPEVTGLKTVPGRRRVRGKISKQRELDVIYIVQADRILVITSFFR